jgi:hypothetical protein
MTIVVVATVVMVTHVGVLVLVPLPPVAATSAGSAENVPVQQAITATRHVLVDRLNV